MGTLQDLLARGGFRNPAGDYNMAGLVATAADVARAMLHLHTEHIIHGDLKVSGGPHTGGVCSWGGGRVATAADVTAAPTTAVGRLPTLRLVAAEGVR